MFVYTAAAGYFAVRNQQPKYSKWFTNAYAVQKVKCTLYRYWDSVQAVRPIGGVDV